jgi:lysophospholipase L1-like esterase
MVVGMVKKYKTCVTHLSLMVVAIFPLIALSAQAQPNGKIVPLSKQCQASGHISQPKRRLVNTLRALRKRKQIRILTIGIAANAATEYGGYQGIIERTLEHAVPGIDVRIIDRGVSGELVRDAINRMKTEIALAEPDLVLWQVGSNDAIARISPTDFRRSLRGGVRWLKRHKIDVILVGTHYVRGLRKDKYYQRIRRIINYVAAKEKVIRIDRYQAAKMIAHMKRGGHFPDEFARTEAGYSCLAEYVARAITSDIVMKNHAIKKQMIKKNEPIQKNQAVKQPVSKSASQTKTP